MYPPKREWKRAPRLSYRGHVQTQGVICLPARPICGARHSLRRSPLAPGASSRKTESLVIALVIGSIRKSGGWRQGHRTHSRGRTLPLDRRYRLADSPTVLECAPPPPS